MRELLDHEAVIASATRTPSCLSGSSPDTGSEVVGSSETTVVFEEGALSIMFSIYRIAEIVLYHLLENLGARLAYIPTWAYCWSWCGFYFVLLET